MNNFTEIWSYLSQGPLLWLSATLLAFAIGDLAFRRLGRRPYVNPVLIAVILLGSLLWLTDTAYATYFEGAQFVHFLLGPATVALALPLWDNLTHVRRAALPIIAALIAGSTTAVASALGIAYALGMRGEVLASLAPKSATAPVALGISDAIGGSPTLTAGLVILTGIIGAIVATPLLNLLGLQDWRARGFAVGVAAHGIGTARHDALQLGRKACELRLDHFDGAADMVVADDGGNGREQADGGCKQRFGDTGRHDRQRCILRLGDRRKAAHDPPDGAEQADERRNSANRRQQAEATGKQIKFGRNRIVQHGSKA